MTKKTCVSFGSLQSKTSVNNRFWNKRWWAEWWVWHWWQWYLSARNSRNALFSLWSHGDTRDSYFTRIAWMTSKPHYSLYYKDSDQPIWLTSSTFHYLLTITPLTPFSPPSPRSPACPCNNNHSAESYFTPSDIAECYFTYLHFLLSSLVIPTCLSGLCFPNGE